MKRILTIILVLCLMVSVVPIPAKATQVVARGSWNGGSTLWELTSDGTLTITGTNNMQGANDPDTYPWKAYTEQVTKIVIAGQVTSICEGAFRNMNNVTTVVIGDTVKSIDARAFGHCTSLTSITIPAGVTKIGEFAFSGCTSLPTVTFAEESELTTLGRYAFAYSGITSQVIPSGVKTLSENTFLECENLVSVTLPEGLEDISKDAFYGCINLKTLQLPSTLTHIVLGAFDKCYGLESLALYKLFDISNYFPDSTNLSTITVCGNPESISGFDHCTSLTNIIIPDSVTRIGNSAFEGCASLTTIDWPESLAYIERDAFDGTGLINITLPDTVVEVEMGAFSRSALREFYCGSGLETISSYMFSNAKDLKTVDLGNVKTIGNNAFEYCSSLENIRWSDALTTIGQYAFRGCDALTVVDIPASVTKIGAGAFSDINSIEIYFYGDAPSFEIYCFSGTTGIAYYPGGNETWTEDVLQNYDGNITWVPYEAESSDTKRGTCGANLTWTLDATGTLTISGTGNMDDYSSDTMPWYDYKSDIKSVVIENGVTSIGTYAFNGCDSLTSVTVGKSVTSIGWATFSGCTNLREITFKGSAPSISDTAFQDVTATVYYPVGDDTWTEEVRQNYDGTITWVATCTNGHTEVIDQGHDVTCSKDGMTEGKHCSVCGEILIPQEVIPAPGHNHIPTVTTPTCTEQGYTTYTCHCGDSYTVDYVDALDHDYQCTSTTNPTCTEDGFELYTCSRCSTTKTVLLIASGHHFGDDTVCDNCGFDTSAPEYPENALMLSGEEFTDQDTVWIGGLPYPVQGEGNERYVELPTEEDCYMVTYTYYVGDAADVHTQYPTGMKVYKISDGEITYIPELDNLLQYSGASIRITGKKGIRMITSLTKDNKNALTGKGLAGFKLLEYGTALCFASEIQEGDALVLGRPFTRSNYAYKRGVADPVFASTKDLIQYTNVLVGFSLDQCKDDIAMRPYIILEDAAGNQITLYGGTIYRSIGYIAYQNRTVFTPKTASYNYVWEIIHHVYGDKYDADYKG